ncbi:MAG: hypothetical protein AB7E61_02410 [Acholeplasmataceae bacterium]
MKKLFTILMLFVMVLTFASCKQQEVDIGQVKTVSLDNLGDYTPEELTQYEQVIRLLILNDDEFILYTTNFGLDMSSYNIVDLVNLYLFYYDQPEQIEETPITTEEEQSEETEQTYVDYTPYLDGNYVFIYVHDYTVVAYSESPYFNLSYVDGLIVPIDKRIYTSMEDQENYAIEQWKNSESYQIWLDNR